MKIKKEIKEKIKRLEKYLEKGKAITELYPLENTESFLGGLKWVLDENKGCGKEFDNGEAFVRCGTIGNLCTNCKENSK